MGIYIKGMRMPENCIKCPMQFGGMCYVMPAEVDESRVAPTVEEAWKQGKPDWCPLVEVPEPHGRLIDGDALRIAELDTLIMIRYKLAYAPTVIEAERRTDDKTDKGSSC